MSAETIPADVLSAAREALAAEFECSVKAFPASPARARRGEMDHTYELKAIVRAILTDRATRPADPAARVAEAGDGECPDCGSPLNSDGECTLDLAVQEADYFAEAQHQIARLTREKEAERARADAAEQRAAVALARVNELEFGAGFEAAFDAVVRPGSKYENWTPADDPAEIVTDLYNDLEDALARAEKAEGSLETARGLAERGAHLARTVSQTRFRLEDGGRYSLSMFDASCIVALAGSAVRASREAQPATDGGGNG